MTASRPSLKQILNRMNGGHATLLEAIRDGRKLDLRTQGEVKGALKLHQTLGVWGAIENGEITPRGLEILDAVYHQPPKAKRPKAKNQDSPNKVESAEGDTTGTDYPF